MNLTELLEKNKETIVEEVYIDLERTHLKHYMESSGVKNKQRLKNLYNLVFLCVKKRTLMPIVVYFQIIGKERFTAGFDCIEVFIAINVLEQTIVEKISKELQSPMLTEALGTVIKVLEAGKSSLARTYVSLASKAKIPKMDISTMFKGTESNYVSS